jgi:hypothetical protein
MRKRLARLSEGDWRVIDRVFAGLVLVVAELEVLLHNNLTGPRGATWRRWP